ncbi:hypothetical protein [Streptomyces sp. NPDC000351]|uniref:hypothetical protein n=1 Tax=Streptomyces sp. NPDC000351 TaxID=3154250 RepID=UPI00333359B3
MKWLLAVAANLDVDLLAAQLSGVGTSISDQTPIPHGTNKKVVYVDGPVDLPARLDHAGIPAAAYPSSPFELH